MNTVFFCDFSVTLITVNIREIWICYSSNFIMKKQARVSGQSRHWCVLCCIISTGQALRGPVPNPPAAFYACTICSRDRSVSLYPALLSAILVNTHPVSAFTVVHGQSNQIEAVLTLAGGLLGSFRTLRSCILNHRPPPQVCTKGITGGWRGGGVEVERKAFSKTTVYFPQLFLRREEDACIGRRKTAPFLTPADSCVGPSSSWPCLPLVWMLFFPTPSPASSFTLWL